MIYELKIPMGKSEREWCDELADKYDAAVEVPLWDKTRVDLLTDTEAIEVDWAHKWAEGIGQSLYYAIVTEKQPAIILLVSNRIKEMKYCHRCLAVCSKYGITLYIEVVGENPKRG